MTNHSNIMENNTLPAIDMDNFKEIVSKAPDVLRMNQTTLANATHAGEKLFALIENDGMSDLYDGELAKYIAKLKEAVKNMNDRRKPFTQLVDHFKKLFTQAEADLKPLHDKAQQLRDNFATQKMNAQRELERQAQLKLNREREAIELRTKVEVFFSEQAQKRIADTKRKMYDLLENSTLDTIEPNRKAIADTHISYPRGEFDNLHYEFTPLYLSKEDVDRIISEVKSSGLFETLNSDHQNQLNAYKREIIDKIPSKKQELINGTAAEEAEKRKIEESERIAREAEEAKRKAESKANLRATAEITNAMVSTQAELSFEEKPRVKEGYEIILKSNAAYLILAQFWFDKEGKTWASDKIEKMTFARVKKFCEDYAVKNDEKVNSPFIEYQEIYKAR